MFLGTNEIRHDVQCDVSSTWHGENARSGTFMPSHPVVWALRLAFLSIFPKSICSTPSSTLNICIRNDVTTP